MQIHGGADWRNQAYRRSYNWKLQLRNDEESERSSFPLDEVSVGDIGLSSRVANRLEEANVFTVKDLFDRQDELMHMLLSMGKCALADCCKALRQFDLDSRYCRPPRKKKVKRR
jgi:DNA-directed RNA polymerase alpha subunit